VEGNGATLWRRYHLGKPKTRTLNVTVGKD
jgi:hypothetical protein